MNKAMIILRWIAVFPGSILGALIVGAIFRFLEYGGMNRMYGGFDPNGQHFIVPILLFWTECVAHGISGAAYIYLGIKIAPSHKKQAAIALAIIGIAMLCSFIFTLEHNYKEVVFLICFGVGLVGMTFTAFNVRSDSFDRKTFE